MVKLGIETLDVGKNILSNLDEQRNKLINIHNRTNNMSNDLIEADNNISKVESWFCFRKKKKKNNKTQDNNVTSNIKSNNRHKLITSNITIPDERNEQINNNLNIIHNMVSDMKDQALIMSGELDNQNDLIDKIDHNVNRNNQHITKLIDRSNKLLR